MSNHVDAALKDRWDTADLASSIGGGIWFDQVPRADDSGQSIDLPLVVVSHAGQSPVAWTNKSQIHDLFVRLALYAADKAELRAGVEQLRTAFDFAPLAADGRQVLEMRPTQGDGTISRQDDGLWQAVLTYRIRYVRAVNYNPS